MCLSWKRIGVRSHQLNDYWESDIIYTANLESTIVSGCNYWITWHNLWSCGVLPFVLFAYSRQLISKDGGIILSSRGFVQVIAFCYVYLFHIVKLQRRTSKLWRPRWRYSVLSCLEMCGNSVWQIQLKKYVVEVLWASASTVSNNIHIYYYLSMDHFTT